MKKIATLCAVALSAVTAFGQSSDDPIYNTSNQFTSEKGPVMTNNFEKSTGNVDVQAPCDSGDVVLVSTNSYFNIWSTDSTASNVIGTNDTLIVPVSSDTSFYHSTLVGNGQDSTLGLPAYSSTYTGNVRGYWFTSPADIIITGLWVPTDVGTGNQNVAIVRFNNNTPPPAYSTTTNDFTQLGLWQNFSANDTISVSIPVMAGEVIGLLGQRGTSNAYAPNNTVQTIAGQPVTLTRLGMQQQLGTNAPADLWYESGGSISLVELFYESGLDTVTTEIPVTVPVSTNETFDVSICPGETYFAQGAAQDSTGMYVDSLTSIHGCDSIVWTNLTVQPIHNTADQISLCPGDSLLINGMYVSTAGTYVDTLQSMYGCDSLVTKDITLSTTNVAVNTSGITLTADATGATYQWLDCNDNFSVIPGATSQSYTATANGNYAVVVTENGCSDTSTCYPVTTLGLQENTFGTNVNLYPNPTAGNFKVDFGTTIEFVEVTITDVTGKIIEKMTVGNQQVVDVKLKGANGYYMVSVADNKGHQARFRVVKQK